MKKRGLLKSIARWTAWVLAVLLPAMWVVSLWASAFVSTPGGSKTIQASSILGGGALGFGVTLDGDWPKSFLTVAERPALPRQWLPHVAHSKRAVGVTVPLWMPWLVALGFSVWFYRDHQRQKQRRLLGCCPACGYDRSGLADSAPCPECGAAPTPP